MGVSGSGKSTIGALLAAALQVQFVDGDSLHPAANIAKMASGVPLDDEDRRPWLASVARALAGADDRGIVVACSALKREYRDEILAGAPDAAFVELDASRDVLEERLGARHGHFMPASLLDSQLATLQPLEVDERGIRVDVGRPAQAVVADIVAELPRLGA